MNKKIFSLTNLWLVLFGLLNLFASGRWTVAPATWLASLFGLRYLHTNPKRRKYLFLYLVLWLTVAIPWYGASPFFGPAHYIFMAVNALVGTIPFFLDSLLAPRLRRNGRLPFIATFTFPLAATALEFLLSSTNPIGNFGAVGYSQYSIPVLTQVSAVTGMLGLTFLISWFPAVINWAWDNGFEWRRVRAGVITFAIVLAAVAGYGAVRLATAPDIEALDTVPVASFTMNENHMGELNELLAEEGVAAYRQETQSVHEQYLAMTETAISDGAKIILWPELAIIGIEEDVQAVVAKGQALAQESGIYLSMPTFTIFPDSDQAAENVLYVAGPDGDIVIEHVKYGGNILEGTVQGSGEIETIETEYGRLSGIICWDTNFPNIVRQVGKQQTDILLSPAKEWAGINPMHAEMAVFRALENGVSVIRQADEGLSIVVDGYGRTLASGEGLVGDGNYLLAQVPTSSPTTLYPVIGDVVGVISVAGLLILAVYAFINGRRQKSGIA
ncbi:MAG: nitrilase-related carbon-nitrogen hydrolase [Candidatus Promineifilaceae bacterium]|nr:nitrilase-related carbon-nitrogen hydrolase [Candidatus Promineifilaceae bacterium]